MSWLVRTRPTAGRSVRLFLAALTWTVLGLALLVVGLRWLLAAGGSLWIVVVPVAVVAGLFKAHLVLASRARSNADRIIRAGEERCLGGMFSWSSWALAVGMMAGGMLLRSSPIPRTWLGGIYATVGTALLVASLAGWSGWRRFVRQRPAP